jgi:dihydrofolate synthase/folylpolyglutamate synthase
VNFREALAWLYAAQTFGIKLGLENTRRLLSAIGDPQDRMSFIHVAGTNGKGSVCAMLDAVLREGGMRPGLYTSPHLVDFSERIRVGGAPIPDEAVAEGLSLLRASSADWDHQPTFFELATVLAAWWFDRSGVGVAIWETGMGGRLDATNVVTPLVSVIAPVGMDHQQWLGSTPAAIAAEKAGIIKPGIPVVSSPQVEEVRAVLRAKARAEGSALRFVSEPCAELIGLPGPHQRWNAALALAALEAAGLAPEAAARTRGLASVSWPGRFQRVGESLVIDGAHNVAAAEALVACWREIFGPRQARLIFGSLHDKQSVQILRVLRAVAEEVVLVPVKNARATPVEELRVAAEGCGFPVISSAPLEEALEKSASLPTVVTGSLFLAGEALALLEGVSRPRLSSQ